MSRRLVMLTEVRVLEEDENACSHDCQHFRMDGTWVRCELFGDRLRGKPRAAPAAPVKWVQCPECLYHAREVVSREDQEWLVEDVPTQVEVVAMRRV